MSNFVHMVVLLTFSFFVGIGLGKIAIFVIHLF